MSASRTIRAVERTTPQGTLVGVVCDGDHKFELWAESASELMALLNVAFVTVQRYSESNSIRSIATRANLSAHYGVDIEPIIDSIGVPFITKVDDSDD